jgi:hypothetical protein
MSDAAEAPVVTIPPKRVAVPHDEMPFAMKQTKVPAWVLKLYPR